MLLAVEGRGTGTTGVAIDELEVEEALDEEEEEEDPPVRLNCPE